MNKNKNFYSLAPGELLGDDIKASLDKINETYSADKNFPKYKEAIRELFQLPVVQKTTESQFFLGGFIEGEGSMSVSAKKGKGARFGMVLDPEFNLTQHVNGISNLYNALDVFQTGRIRYKSGSNATMVLTIDNRQSLVEKVIPFYQDYIIFNGSPYKKDRFNQFKQILELFGSSCHTDLDCFTNKMLPIWDDMRMQKGQSNETFLDLKAAQDFARNFKKEKQ
jgi:hypothetical protein